MPLLDGKAHLLSTATPLSFRPDEQVFVLQTTGEIVSDFQRYTELHKLYRCKKWAAITGKTGLTYEDAAREEEKNKSLAEKVSYSSFDCALSAKVVWGPKKYRYLAVSPGYCRRCYTNRSPQPASVGRAHHYDTRQVQSVWQASLRAGQQILSI